jgi:hypothetical protein
MSVAAVSRQGSPGRDAAGLITLRVLDDGPGLRGVEVSKLFDDFSAAANAVGSRTGVKSSGLGLPICGRLVRLMGGCLRALLVHYSIFNDVRMLVFMGLTYGARVQAAHSLCATGRTA